MLAGIPLLTFLFLFVLCLSPETEWRRSFLSAALLWGALLTGMTEFLSLFHLVTVPGVAAAWTVASLAIGIGARRHLHFPVQIRRAAISEIPRPLLLMIGAVAGIVTVTGLIGITAPPNTWDAMTYHMSRVMQWIQNQSVAHYPTHTSMQLHRSPWAEFANLHFRLLGHTDRLANLVQWFGMVGSVLVVSLIARQLGADAHGQAFAALVAATLPIGILESTSTQTDYVGTFWLLCLVSSVLTTAATPSAFLTWRLGAQLGASLGLAVLTKPSNYLYALPFLTWMTVSLTKAGWRRGIGILAIVALVALAINHGHYTRNFQLYGDPIGPNVEETCTECGLVNEAWTVPLIFSNVIRNVAINLGTPSESVNTALEYAIEQVHAWMGISTSDVRNTYLGFLFKIQPPIFSEDYDGNLLHLLLVLGTTGLLFLYGRRIVPSLIWIYALALCAGFVSLCVLVKWNPFNSRVQLPLFVLWAPITALLLSRFRTWIPPVIAAILCLSALPWLLLNARHPIVTVETPAPRHLAHLYRASTNPSILEASRASQYFYAQHRLEPRFQKLVKVLTEHGCFNIGLMKGWDDWEYPLWPLLQADSTRQVRIEHIDVRNRSGALAHQEPFASFTPCAYVLIDRLEIEVMLLPLAASAQLPATLSDSRPMFDGHEGSPGSARTLR